MGGEAPYSTYQDKVDSAIESGWFRVFLPPSLGGICSQMSEALSILTESARINGSLGWAVNLGAGASWFYPYVSVQMAEKVWGNPQAIVAGSGKIGQLELLKDGQARLTGFWPRCTAAPWATWFTLNAQTKDGQVWTCMVPREEVLLHPDAWQQFGLNQSGTYAVEAVQVLLQAPQVFSTEEARWRSGHFTEQWPFPHFARACMSATFLGLWKGLHGQYLKEAGRSVHHEKMQGLVGEWEHLLYIGVNQADISETELTTVHWAAMDLALILYRDAGMRIGQLGHPMHVAWSDFMTAAHHPFLW